MKLNVERKCSENNCDCISYAKDLCKKHWRDMGGPRRGILERKCSKEGCERIHYAKGFCNRHWQKARNAPFVKRPNRDNGATSERDSEGRKFCIKCKIWYPTDNFTKHPRTRDRLAVYCRSCIINDARYRQYKVTPEKLRELFRLQNNACAICKKDIRRRFTIDHDHSCCSETVTCGKCVRGLLCDKCNLGLGSFEDSYTFLEAAIEYVKRRSVPSDK